MGSFDPFLELQAAIRARLIASPDLLALVPDGHVLDTSGRPEVMPAVLIGEGQTVYRRFDCTVFATLHVWFQELGTTSAKQAASAIVEALRIDAQRDGVLSLPHWTVLDMQADRVQIVRDPHGPYSHGIVSVAAIMKAK